MAKIVLFIGPPNNMTIEPGFPFLHLSLAHRTLLLRIYSTGFSPEHRQRGMRGISGPLPMYGFSATDCRVSKPSPEVKEMVVLTFSRPRAIIELLDILVDIGVPAEKEVIQ